MKKSKKNVFKMLRKGECRVIRIGTEVIYELLRENMIENCEKYFDIRNIQDDQTYYWFFNYESDEFVCCISKDKYLDFDHVMELVPTSTTDSLYYQNRYVSIFPKKDNKLEDKKENSKKSKKNVFKILKKGECRVIRIETEAIYELLREDTKRNCEKYFDMPNIPDFQMMYYWFLDDETGEFVCCISKDMYLDFDHVIEVVSTPTTDSLYRLNHYESIFPKKDIESDQIVKHDEDEE